MPKFKDYNQYQSMLLPPSLVDCLPESHICYVINDIVDNLDISAIEQTYSELGCPAYDPRLLTKVLFYGHVQGIRSSRKIESRMKEDLGFRFLSANHFPDHGTISLFRKNHLTALNEIFSQTVIMSSNLNMIDPSDISIDGTKIKADASRKNLFDQEAIEKLRKRFDAEFAEADAIDAAEDKIFGDSVGYNLVPGMEDPEKRKKKIKEMLEKMKKLKEAETDIKDKQTKAKTKEAKNLKKNTSSNITDPDACLMKMKDKSYKMAYNAQFATANQIITAYGLNNEAADVSSLQDMINASENNTGVKIKTVKADAGYFSFDNIDFCNTNQIDAYIPDCEKATEEYQERHDAVPQYDRRQFQYNEEKDEFVCPAGKVLKFKQSKGKNNRLYTGTDCGSCPHKEQCTKAKNRNLIINFQQMEEIKIMRAKLNTQEGKDKYTQRMSEIEPVIGNIKYNQNFNHFLCRGKTMTLTELGLASTAHNLIKIFHWLKRNNISRKKLQWNTLMSLQASS